MLNWLGAIIVFILLLPFALIIGVAKVAVIVILLFITGCGTIVLGILFLGGIRQPAEFMNAWWGKNGKN